MWAAADVAFAGADDGGCYCAAPAGTDGAAVP